MGRIFVSAAREWALVAVSATAVVVLLGGCHRQISSGGVYEGDVQRQLAAVIGVRLQSQHFYGRKVTISCKPTSDDKLNFACDIWAGHEGEKTQIWHETVGCTPTNDGRTPRCFGSEGEALQ
ncbi:MAG: hypothetical protein F2663_05340 [Actinobacteria bacterium]|uniref:Unannotated protein n=1 Tax=freshwater metagenome TaxID=449393 RepID=A0A6J6PDL6_9ZZZZ|nr:hypothetical protein [Actinomycetota bacterium]